MAIVKAENLSYDYMRYIDDEHDPEPNRAVDNVSLEVKEGDFVAILGHNGSGKSTFAKHINALLTPTEGTMWIDGIDTHVEDESIWKIRQKAGIVFQNPDNQIIGTSVEEDVGFGPENVGMPTEDIWKRVDDALEKVGMTAYRNVSPNHLSGGQKQRVAIAGIVAMHPQCIVLDEPTAMLDPDGRKEVINVLHELNKNEGVTIILITHYMEEVTQADHIFVMDGGKVVMEGSPKEIFAKVDELKSIRLDVPQVTELGFELKKGGLPIADGILTIDELVEEMAKLNLTKSGAEALTKVNEIEGLGKTILELRNVDYFYSKDSVFERKALENVDLVVNEGEFIAIIGHTGSGKSTLIQLMNGLQKPSNGEVIFENQNINADGYDRRMLRTRVGLVFQYPENQLFETDVITDVCFGPKNQGLLKEEALEKAAKALKNVEVSEELFDKSPFELSGGQKRRVAIAGILAMNPKVLILDEPTAGLDPKGRDAILNEAKRLQEEEGITVILVSHSMEDVAKYATRLVVMSEGRKVKDGKPKEIFKAYKELEDINLMAPQVTYIMNALASRGIIENTDAITIDEARESILKEVKVLC